MGEKVKKVRKFFWNTENGYTAQSHAFLLFTTPYALFWMLTGILTLCGVVVDPMMIQLLEIMQTPMMVIIGGLFSVTVASEIKKPNGGSNKIETSQSQGSPQVNQSYDYTSQNNQQYSSNTNQTYNQTYNSNNYDKYNEPPI